MMDTALILLLGEFGIVYEAKLMNWHGHRKKLTVAVKTLKCTCNFRGIHCAHM